MIIKYFLLLFFFINQSFADNLLDIQNSINAIKTMQADITRVDSKSDNATGSFYLAKPDKMRIEYKSNKSNIVIVANKELVTYHDKELDEVSYVPTNNTIASILMTKNINFNDFEILKFSQKNGLYNILFYKKKQKDDGIFRFTFKKDDDFILQRIDKYSDETLRESASILFTKVITNIDINDKLFIIKDKRLY